MERRLPLSSFLMNVTRARSPRPTSKRSLLITWPSTSTSTGGVYFPPSLPRTDTGKVQKNLIRKNPAYFIPEA
ncbi:hypothetical protein MTO96_018774 [Rhipicephalus appendiculatus]